VERGTRATIGGRPGRVEDLEIAGRDAVLSACRIRSPRDFISIRPRRLRPEWGCQTRAHCSLRWIESKSGNCVSAAVGVPSITQPDRFVIRWRSTLSQQECLAVDAHSAWAGRDVAMRRRRGRDEDSLDIRHPSPILGD